MFKVIWERGRTPPPTYAPLRSSTFTVHTRIIISYGGECTHLPLGQGSRYIAPPRPPPQKKTLLLPVADLDYHLIHPADPPPQTVAKIGSAVFAQALAPSDSVFKALGIDYLTYLLTRLLPMDRPTDRPTERTWNSTRTNRPLTWYQTERRSLIRVTV